MEGKEKIVYLNLLKNRIKKKIYFQIKASMIGALKALNS